MNLFFDVVSVVFAIIIQLICGDLLAVQLPFAVYVLLALSMRRGVFPAVATALFAGFVIDLASGREFASALLAMPAAVAVASAMLPVEPIRFSMADYVLPGVVSGGVHSLIQLITPLFMGEEWFYLAGNSAEIVASLLPGAFLLPLVIFISDRLAKALEVERIFKRTIAVVLRSARR